METNNTLEKSQRESQPVSYSTATNAADQDRLISAGYQVLNYLREKRLGGNPHYAQQSITVLEIALQSALSKPIHPSGRRDELLYQSTQKGLIIMKEDYHTAKAASQDKNEQYIAQRNFLSEKGIQFIRQEADKGEFSVANGQQGYIVASRIEAIQKILHDSREGARALKPARPTNPEVQTKNKERTVESLASKTGRRQTLQEDSSQKKQTSDNLEMKQDTSHRTRFRR